VCIDTVNNCNTKPPYSEINLKYGINPITKEKYTKKEIGNKNKQYDNMCNLAGTEIKRCCDPENPFYNNVLSGDIPKNIKLKKIIKKGEHTGYYTCNSDLYLCPDEYQDIKPHDMCKTKGQFKDKITNIVPDCLTSSCDNSNYVPFIAGPYDIKRSNLDDYQLIKAVKKDDLNTLKNYFNNNNTINRILKEGYPGNTILHEAIVYKATNCINFILEMNNVNYNIKNKDGNTPIHLLALQGNSNLIYKLIKLGARLDIRNVYKDSILHSAVRSGELDPVVVILSQGGDIMDKNMLGETPLHTAIMSPTKNLKTIIQLVEMGSDLLTKNNNDFNLMKSLSLFKKTQKNEEIRTYIQSEIYKRHKSDYYSIIDENPELSFINVVNRKTNEKESLDRYDNLDELKITYPDEHVSNQYLYRPKKNLPVKIFPEVGGNPLVEGFTVNKDVLNELKEMDSIPTKNCGKYIQYSTLILVIAIFLLIVFKYLR